LRKNSRWIVLDAWASIGFFAAPSGGGRREVCATLAEATGGRYPDAAEGYPKAAEISVGARPKAQIATIRKLQE
jgi:hypothetical protein